MKWTKHLLLSALLLFGARLLSVGQTYTWNNVRIGGGGLVTSVNAHPKVAHLRFATTDVGTAYRWNETLQRWEGMMNFFPTIYWGVACGNLAFAPNDATGNILYATIAKGAVAGSSAGAIMKSTDRGNTWTDCNFNIFTNPNDGAEKFLGERLAVDPNNSSVIYVTTRIPASGSETQNGTWRSVDAGVTWTKIDTIHGRYIVFDTSGGTISGLTKKVYIGSLQGVYKSADAGSTFSLISGSPTDTRKGTLAGNGLLYTFKPSVVYRYNDTTWTTITPAGAGAGFSGIDVNPNNSKDVIISTGVYNGEMFKSNNRGASWTKVAGKRDGSEVPWQAGGIGTSINDVSWDPTDTTQVWLGDLVNLMQGYNVWSDTATWKVRAVGHEEVVVAGNMASPPGGTNVLLTALADMGGFEHHDPLVVPTKSVTNDFQYYGTTGVHMTSVAFQQNNPNFIARVGRRGWTGAGMGGYSTDGGLHYTNWVTPTGMTGGRIAVSATSETMIWTTQTGWTYRSADRGNTWTKIASITSVAVGSAVTPSSIFTVPAEMNPLAADKVNGNKFYLLLFGKMMVSTDGGNTFTQGYASLPNTGNVAYVKVETTPGVEGDVWVSFEGYGLYHSTDSGLNFTKIANISSAKFMSVGKGTGNGTAPCVYVLGTINSVANVLARSDDNGATWVTVSNPPVAQPLGMVADGRTYGTVYIASAGNGIFVGTANSAPVTGVTVSPTTISIAIGQQSTLKAVVAPAWAANKKVHWSSNDTTKVKVNDSTGVITGIALTSTAVSVVATTDDGAKTATVSVTVTTPIAVSGITITPNPDTVGINNTFILSAAITPSNASNKTLKWTSSDTTKARIDSLTGAVTGIAAGTVTITAVAQDSGFTSTSTVFVKNISPTAITVSGNTSVGVEDTTRLSVTFNPPTASNQSVTWSSSDTTKAKVNATGLVTAIGAGSVTITATTVDGGITGTKAMTIVSEGSCGSMINPGFESGFKHWFLVGDTLNGNPPVSITTTGVHSGLKAAVITGMVGVSSDQYMAVPGKKAVTFTVWAKAVDGPLWSGIGIDYNDSTGTKITADQFTVTDSTYKQFSVTRVTPPNTAFVSVWTAKASPAGRLYLDDFCVTVVPAVDVTGITVSPSPTSVAMTNTTTLTATIIPSNATIKTITWASSNTAIATVGSTGIVTGVALGTAVIIATTTDGGFVARDTVTVTTPIAVTALNITPDTVSVTVSDSYSLVPNFTPSNASNKNVAWTSSNTAIATVNATTGVVKGIATGTCYIKGVTADGGKKDSSVINVVPIATCGLINNNGFEGSLISWNGNSAFAITTNPSDVHSGAKAVTTSIQGTLGYTGSLPFTVGDTMTFSVYGKVGSGTAPVWTGLALDCMNSAGTKLVSAAFTITGTSYTLYTQQFVVPAGTTNLNLWAFKSGADGSVFLDDFCLTVVHAGGSSRVSNVVLKGEQPVVDGGELSVSAFPNPVQNDINLRIGNYKGGRVTVTLTDIHGRVVHNEQLNVQKGLNVYKLHPVRKPSTGIYILTVTGDGVRNSFKLIVP